LGVLAEYVPVALIDEVLADTGRLQQRVRRLPARVTVLFILALTLFSGQGYRGVWRELAHNGADAGVTPSSSALAQARRRVGHPQAGRRGRQSSGIRRTRAASREKVTTPLMSCQVATPGQAGQPYAEGPPLPTWRAISPS
jgi:hypothetical protein